MPQNKSSEIITLKDGSKGTILYLRNSTEANAVPEDLLEQLRALYNAVIEEGLTYPYVELADTLEEFKKVWMANATAIMVSGEHENLGPGLTLLGTYYVKPNYAGRCSHVSNAGFLVSLASRGKGLGKILGMSYLRWAPTLGYTYSVFNLVFETNEASWRIWESLGFQRIGVVPGAARLKGIGHPVTAYMYGKELQ